MDGRKVLLLGGSGFIGYALAEQLSRRGFAVTVPTRHVARARHLLLLPTVEVIAADVHDRAALNACLRGQDAVINLIGILHGDFERTHVALPKAVAESCARAQVPRLIHMSALNADINGPSEYLRSRGRGEAAVREVASQHPALAVTMFQPSVVFGEGDRFLNMFANLTKLSPFIPLGSPDATFQPVWVEDVARAIAMSVDLRETADRSYPLVGPSVYSLRQLLTFVMELTGKYRPIVGLGATLSALLAAVFGMLPGKLITLDNVRSMRIPNTSQEPFPSIFGVAHAMEAIVPAYMGRVNEYPGRPRYDRFRSGAGRAQ